MVPQKQQSDGDKCLSDLQRGRVQMAQTIVNDIFYSDTTFTLRQALKFLQDPQFESLLDDIQVGNRKPLNKVDDPFKRHEHPAVEAKAASQAVISSWSKCKRFLYKLVSERPPSFADIAVSEIIGAFKENLPAIHSDEIRYELKSLVTDRYLRKSSVSGTLRFALGEIKP